MFDPQEYEGHWWLPDDEERTYPGRLTFTATDAGRLDLLVGDDETDRFDVGSEIEIICGVSTSGKPLTLVKTFVSATKGSVFSSTSVSIFAHELFVGRHYRRAEDIRFTHLMVRYTDLDAFVSAKVFDVTFDQPGSASVDYHRPEAITGAL